MNPSSTTSSPIIIIAGATASGKSRLAIEIAKKYQGVVINADSKQVYENIPHITAQPSEEQKKEAEHALYDFYPVTERYNVGKWVKDAEKTINKAKSVKKVPIIVGGTGMYIHALVNGIADLPEITWDVREKCQKIYEEGGTKGLYMHLNREDPLICRKILAQDKARITRALEVIYSTGQSLAHWQSQPRYIPFPLESFYIYVLHKPRNVLYTQATERFDKMLHDNVLEEIQLLRAFNLDPLLPSMRSLGIPQLIKYLNGEWTLEKAREESLLQTRNYIKRQETWFRHQLKGAFWGNEEDIITNLKLC